MYHNARFREVAVNLRHLRHGDPFLDQLQQPVRRDFQSAGHRDATTGFQQQAEIAGKALLEPDIGPPANGQFPFDDLQRQCPHECRGRGFVHEVETGFTGLRDDLFHPVDQHRCGDGFVQPDIIEGDVAKVHLPQ